jgi:hypothetical protein
LRESEVGEMENKDERKNKCIHRQDKLDWSTETYKEITACMYGWIRGDR